MKNFDSNKRNYSLASIYILLATLVVLLALFIANLVFGSISIPADQVIRSLFGLSVENNVWELIVIKTRLPQTLVALGAGMGLGISGLLMQTMFRNPLAGPSVLGISSGSSLGVALVLLVADQCFHIVYSSVGFWGDFAVIVASLLGAFIVLFTVLYVSKHLDGTLGVLIMGVMFGYLTNAIVSVLKFYSTEESIQSYVLWGLGSFSRLNLDQSFRFCIAMIVGSLSTLFFSKSLDLLSLGDRYAQNLGLNVDRTRRTIIFLAGVLTALVTAFCGPVIFVGVAVPHISKLILKTSKHLLLILECCLMGGVVTLFCCLVSRMPGSESTLPINSVTAFIGAPIIISIIWKKRRM
ncbi:iron ABC transporter permease [Halosquirtibacter laminarini]|uniref:Iron ABC transporter permease n=1 Tax=Halosquirtibacter laminarini TaxID=3374600 RepID=A0AC61NNP8_9BACT|nr:iron ABC transporter permease [Prolixibacteraceae bacterium]